jgi:exopolysaccharide biosynthesis polyprenyl glycosylphosphotransferase
MSSSIKKTAGPAVEKRTGRRIWLPSLGLHASERRLLLRVVDLLLLNGSLVVALWLTTDLIQGPSVFWSGAKWFITLSVLWLMVAAVFDVYNLARAASASASVMAIMAAALLTSSVYMFIPWFTPPIVGRGQAYVFVAIAGGILCAWRFFYARYFVQPTFHRRVLVVGAGESGRALVEALQSDFARKDANPFRGTGYQVVGFVDDDPGLHGQQISGVSVVGSSADLVSLVERFAINELVVAITYTNIINAPLLEAILDCREMGLPVITMATIYERLTGRVAVAHMGGNVELASGSQENAFWRLYQNLKQILDVVGALLSLPILLLAIPPVWLANRLASPGPLLFRQERVGQGGKPIVVIKFRSMIPEAEKGLGAVWAAADDERITAVGRFLRKTHLDELPQIINVLRGEMSLVGPRPERPQFVQELSRQIPFYRVRHCLKPGITGWAQIHQHYGDSLEGAQEKLEYDLYYVKHATPILDALIILRTISKVFGLKGR